MSVKADVIMAVCPPLTEDEVSEVFDGLRVAVAGVDDHRTQAQVEAYVNASIESPSGLGDAMAVQVSRAVAAIVFLGVAIRTMRIVAEDNLVWPPEVMPTGIDGQPMAPGSKLVQ